MWYICRNTGLIWLIWIDGVNINHQVNINWLIYSFEMMGGFMGFLGDSRMCPVILRLPWMNFFSFDTPF